MGELVVAGVDPALVFEPADGALDEIGLFVAGAIEPVDADAAWIVWDDGLCAVAEHEAAQSVAVVGGIGQTKGRRRQASQQGVRRRRVVALTRCQCEG